MSAVDLIFAFRTPTDATVTRQDAAGSYVNGEYVGGATTDFEIQMSIQPLTAKDGRNFEVMTVEYWESAGNTIVPYWKVTMAEVNPT